MLPLSFSTERLFLSIAILVLMTPVTNAAMYKWVDDEGNTVYSQSPPPGDIDAETMKPPPSVDTEGAIRELEMQEKKLGELREARQKEAKERTEAEQKLAEKEEYCRKIKSRLASLQRPRVNTVGEDGTRSVMGEKERQDEIAGVMEKIEKSCK